MNLAWLLLLLTAAVALYAMRLRKQLQHYRVKYRALKNNRSDAASDVVDGDRLDALLVAMNEAVFRLDASGRVVGANLRAKEAFAMQGAVFPLSMRQVYRDTDWHDVFQNALQVLPEQACLPDMHLADEVLSPRLAALNADSMLLLCVDVSEQRRLEQQRRTFLSNLMHDLKTPLTSLLGYARSLDSFGDDADFRKEAASVIADEAKHVNHLLDALLTLDQVEFSVRDADVSCCLDDVLQGVLDMLQPACVEAGVVLSANEAGRSKQQLRIADDDLERILTNLLVNAVNYAPVDSQVIVSMRIVESACTIVIEDAGEGIPEHELARVTERFYQVDKARTRKNGGHGLGLAIVKELAEKNMGQLRLCNRAGGGLRVEVVLCCAQGDVPVAVQKTGAL